MRDRVAVLAKACAIVGIALALHGTLSDRAMTYRMGMLTLVTSIGVTLQLTSRAAVQEVMAQQARVARLGVRERQQYAELGYRAAQIDAQAHQAPSRPGGAEVFTFPHARQNPAMRRNGSA
jgi:hypothetical protein